VNHITTIALIRNALDNVSGCALDDNNDVRKVTCALMKALVLPHWTLVQEVLDAPHCQHCDCAGNLYATSDDFYPHVFMWRCDECSAYTCVDVRQGTTWTEPS
jgi:hypothetical protein